MRQIVIMPGGFHPFHAGHAALYRSAVEAFNNADVYVAATNDTKTRPFPFAIKEKLAKLAGVADKHFVQVKSPFKAEEITSHYNPNEDVLIFVRSEKDKTEQPKPGGTKKDGTPAYFQPYTGKNLQPFSKHAYIAYLPTIEFGPGITSATEIRNAWPKLNDKRKTAMVMSLYPVTQKNPKLASNVVKMLDMGMGNELDEDISRRGFLKGMGAAAAAVAGGKAGAGQFTSADDLNKDTESVEKVWKPRMKELEARCNGILNSFKSVASSVNPEWVSIINQVKIEVTLGDTTLRFAKARAQTQTQTQTRTTSTLSWGELLRNNPNEYAIKVWSKIYPNISYRGSADPGLNPIIDIQTRPDGTILTSKLVTPSKDSTWDQAVLGAISKAKIIPPRPVPADKKSSNQITRINFPIRFLSANNPVSPSISTTTKSTYKIFIETTLFWDAPDSTLAWVLGHEIGHLVNGHPSNAPTEQSRNNELEADEVGAILAQKIGYNRANFFQWLHNTRAENIKNSDPNPTHPEPIDRVNNLKQKTGFELATVKYIDSMIQQFQNGLAENIKVEPVAKSLRIQTTQTQPKQNIYVAPEKKTPAVVNHIKPKDIKEGTNLSVEQLAHISDKALDDAYHYGRSTPGANFGWLANIQSATAAKRLIDAGVTDIEKISDAIHKGWNVTAAADYKGQLKLDTPTPDDKKLKRAKLAMQSYSQLPEEEKEKDRVVARALLQAIRGDNLTEFAPPGGDDREPDEEEILRQLASQWWLGTAQQMAKAERTLELMGWEIGQDESGDDDAGVFVIRAGDENGNSYIAFPHSALSLDDINEDYLEEN